MRPPIDTSPARAIALCLLAVVLFAGCKSADGPAVPSPGSTGGAAGGAGGSLPVGPVGGSPGATGGTGGGTTSVGGSDAGATPTGGTVGAAPADASDAPTERSQPGADAGRAGDAVVPESDFLPGRPDIRLCKKEWSNEQCCAFLCSCLGSICADSAKARPGLAGCMSWCPRLSSMAARCHVYHCYISVSPTGGIKDHDSHCGHAANEVQGGDCPTVVYQ
jgi:hypothetical protein